MLAAPRPEQGRRRNYSRRNINTDDVGWSFLPDLMIQLKAMLHTLEDPRFGDELAEGVARTAASGFEAELTDLVITMEERAPGPYVKVSFLAKRLLTGRHT